MWAEGRAKAKLDNVRNKTKYVSYIYNNVRWYIDKGKGKERPDIYKIDISEYVAQSYNNLGFMCRDKGDLEQASDYLQQAQKIQLEHLGENHVGKTSEPGSHTYDKQP